VDILPYDFEDILMTSDIGVPENWSTYPVTAETPLFTHDFRVDKNKQYR
jgi:hypothetical protein